MSKVVYAPGAQMDLVEIGGFIAADSEHQAEIFVARLREKAQQIAQSPRIYRARDDLSPSIRSAAIGDYVLLFRIIQDGVEVARVVHGARDLKRPFED